MSDQSSSQRIIEEQEELAQRYLRESQEAEAKDHERAEMQRAWDAVRYWLAPDGRLASRDTGVEADPAVAVESIAHLNKMLAKRGMLDRLAEPPAGVEGEDLQAWQVGRDILFKAPGDPSEAGWLVGAIRGKPFASTVRNWLCDGFRIVVEGRWQTGPLCAELMPSRIISVKSESEPAALEQVATSDERPAGDLTNVGEHRSEGMTWQDAAVRLKRLRSLGDPWPGYRAMADRLGRSPATVHKAVRNTPELQTWAKHQSSAAPRSQSLNDVVTDRTAQSREPDPEDDAAIREYLERDLKPEERAFFNSLSREDQLDFLDDPDEHQRILGRKP